MLALAKLPFSLLVSSFVLACTALPVQSAEAELLVLTPDNFESTIAEGVWLVLRTLLCCTSIAHNSPA